MVVPHRGGDSSFSLRIPIKIIKAAAVALVCLLAGGLASFAHYQSTIQEAKAEQQELAYLRANREQQERIERRVIFVQPISQDLKEKLLNVCSKTPVTKTLLRSLDIQTVIL